MNLAALPLADINTDEPLGIFLVIVAALLAVVILLKIIDRL